MNKVILVGRLTRDAEVREASGTTVAKFSLAVNRRFKREGEQTADFINCVAFGKTAEIIKKYTHKGKQVGVIGRLAISSYTDKDGNNRYSTEVVIEENELLGGKQDTADVIKDGFYPISDDVEDDDLPF